MVMAAGGREAGCWMVVVDGEDGGSCEGGRVLDGDGWWWGW